MTRNEPGHIATGMIANRGREAALARCDRYISGDIRSEEPKSFWVKVREEILESK